MRLFNFRWLIFNSAELDKSSVKWHRYVNYPLWITWIHIIRRRRRRGWWRRKNIPFSIPSFHLLRLGIVLLLSSFSTFPWNFCFAYACQNSTNFRFVRFFLRGQINVAICRGNDRSRSYSFHRMLYGKPQPSPKRLSTFFSAISTTWWIWHIQLYNGARSTSRFLADLLDFIYTYSPNQLKRMNAKAPKHKQKHSCFEVISVDAKRTNNFTNMIWPYTRGEYRAKKSCFDELSKQNQSAELVSAWTPTNAEKYQIISI